LDLKLKPETIKPALSASVLTAFILFFARWKVPFDIILLDRFLPGWGWLAIILMAVYSFFITHRMLSAVDTSRLRRTIWLAFSIVFFSQFILGVSGIEKLLMTGKLHIPVPAVVIAGPIYRGERFFMPILFLSTIVLTGPGWCSFLCYIGSWDGWLASAQKRASTRKPVWNIIRVILLSAVIITAILLRRFGVTGIAAALPAIGFGAAGVLIMVIVSARKGTMIHCTSFCPLGLTANIMGKISPFRLKIDKSCSSCGRCIPVCRYGALDMKKIERRRPGYTCTLCGDCISVCPENSLGYSFPGCSSSSSRTAYFVIVIALHAAFLAVARI
jgi:polyferredoxin